MGRFKHTDTGVVVSVDDSKDDRFGSVWEPVVEGEEPEPEPEPTAKPTKK